MHQSITLTHLLPYHYEQIKIQPVVNLLKPEDTILDLCHLATAFIIGFDVIWEFVPVKHAETTVITMLYFTVR